MSGPLFFVLVTTAFFGLCLLEASRLIRWLIADRKRAR